MTTSVKLCVFALLISNVLLQDMSGFTLMNSQLRYLQDKANTDGIFIYGAAAKINSLQVDGQEYITTAIDENKVTFIELKASLGSFIEIQSTATNPTNVQPSITIAVSYMNEEGQKEYTVSNSEWFCNEYPAKKVATVSLNDLFKITNEGFGL